MTVPLPPSPSVPPVDRERLRELAEKALAGEASGFGLLAAMSPDVVLSLLDALDRAEKERAWLSADQARIDRCRIEADEEVAALRRLVSDFIDEAAPMLRKMTLSALSPASWQRRAMTAVAGIRLSKKTEAPA